MGLTELKPSIYERHALFEMFTSDAYQIAIDRQGSLFSIKFLASFCLLLMSSQAGSCCLQWVCKVENSGKSHCTWDYSPNKDSFHDCRRNSSQCQEGDTT